MARSINAILLVLAAVLLVPAASYAAGLGTISVRSALGQPLDAEIEVVSVQPGEDFQVRLAGREAYREAGVELSPALQNARFTIEKRDGRTLIRVRTTQPVNDPFFTILVELNWPTGRLARQYTVLVDPVEYKTASAPTPQAAAPAPSVSPAPARAQAQPPKAAAKAPAPVVGSPAPVAAAPASAPAPAAVAAAPVAAPVAPTVAPAPQAAATPTPAPAPIVVAPTPAPTPAPAPIAVAPTPAPTPAPAPIAVAPTPAPTPAPAPVAVAPTPAPTPAPAPIAVAPTPAPTPAPAPIAVAPTPAPTPAPAPVAVAPTPAPTPALTSVAAAAAPAPTPAPTPVAAATSPAPTLAPAPAQTAAAPAKAHGTDVSDTYLIRRGDTLGAIARKWKPEGVTYDQMLVGLYQTNRPVFIRDNINLIRAGATLFIPGRNDVLAINAADATRQVRMQMAAFTKHRDTAVSVGSGSAQISQAQRDAISRRAGSKKSPRAL